MAAAIVPVSTNILRPSPNDTKSALCNTEIHINPNKHYRKAAQSTTH